MSPDFLDFRNIHCSPPRRHRQTLARACGAGTASPTEEIFAVCIAHTKSMLVSIFVTSSDVFSCSCTDSPLKEIYQISAICIAHTKSMLVSHFVASSDVFLCHGQARCNSQTSGNTCYGCAMSALELAPGHIKDNRHRLS